MVKVNDHGERTRVREGQRVGQKLIEDGLVEVFVHGIETQFDAAKEAVCVGRVGESLCFDLVVPRSTEVVGGETSADEDES